jgi:ABC-type lipoprotein release transport system permease subunit
MKTPWDSATTWMTVIGVVNDVKQNNFRETGQSVMYLPLSGPTPRSWALGSPAYVLKTARAATIAPEVRELVRAIAPEAPMYRVFTLEQLTRDSMVTLSFTMLTLGIAAALALVLGAVGLYGILSYIVAERTREIGVRMALGAEAGTVRRMVVLQGIRVVGAGVVLGVLIAVASTRLLSTLLYGVAALDSMTFIGTSAAMLAVGFLASYLPGRRASNIDPIVSMRTD